MTDEVLMSSNKTQDVRAIANLIIRIAMAREIPVSNLSLNKIVYFLHEFFLAQFGRPLVSAKIEAWDHGPVFRELYHQFKRFGRETITDLASRIDPATGEREIPETSLSEEECLFLLDNCNKLLEISPGKLVDMSHVKNGPWFRARYGDGRVNPGVEITNDLILESFSSLSRN